MKQSFWCWLRRHRMLVGGYDYSDGLMTPVMVCQCKIADAEIPSFKDQMKRKQKCQACQHYPQFDGVCHMGKLMDADYNACVEFEPMPKLDGKRK